MIVRNKNVLSNYLEEKRIVGVVKYNTYEKEIKKSFKKKTFNAENWKYDVKTGTRQKSKPIIF